MIEKHLSPSRVMPVIFVTILLSPLAGCELKQQTEELRETGRKLKSDMEEIKAYGQVDPQTRLTLELFYEAYVACTESGNPPENWSDLMTRSGLNQMKIIDLRSAQKEIKDVVWGASLDQLEDAEKAKAKLASVQNELLGNIVILQADGKFRLVSQNELGQIPLAE